MERNIFNQLGILPLSLNTLFEEFSKDFEQFNTMKNPFDDSHFYKNYPQADIYYIKDQDKYVIELLVPNFKSEELSIRVDEKTLFVSGSKEEEQLDENVKSIYHGIGSRSFKEKPYYFEKTIKEVNADLEHNILKIEVTLKNEEDSKVISINTKS